MNEVNAKYSHVKIFTATNPDNLESEIQKWLSSLPEEATIYQIKYAIAGTANEGGYIYSALILFNTSRTHHYL